MNQYCRIKMHLSCVTVAVLIGLPAYAHAGLYKCVDEKTKSIAYSGTPCVSGNESKLSITENAIMDGTAAQREITKRQMANQASQESARCEPSSAVLTEVRVAENALRVAKEAAHSTGQRAVRDAQANLEAARDRRDFPCDPGVVQQRRAARETASAADDARRQQALEKIQQNDINTRQTSQLNDINDKLDSIKRTLPPW